MKATEDDPSLYACTTGISGNCTDGLLDCIAERVAHQDMALLDMLGLFGGNSNQRIHKAVQASPDTPVSPMVCNPIFRA
jgi:hypothetical protein